MDESHVIDVLKEKEFNIEQKVESVKPQKNIDPSRAISAQRVFLNSNLKLNKRVNNVNSKGHLMTPQEQILAYYANRAAEANSNSNKTNQNIANNGVNVTINGNPNLKIVKKGHNRCNSSGVGIAPSKLLQYKRAELEKTAVMVSPVTQITAPGTTKANDKNKFTFGCTQKLVFDHINNDPARPKLKSGEQRKKENIEKQEPQKITTDYQNYMNSGYNKGILKGVITATKPKQEDKEVKNDQTQICLGLDSTNSNDPAINEINVSGKMEQHLENLVVGKQVGQGAYATVKVAYHKGLDKKVALKIYDKTKLIEPQRQKSVQREIKIMERLSNPFIAKLYDAFDTQKQVVLVMELVRGMSLHGYLKSKSGRRLPEPEARRLFRQIVTGIGYCHGKSITHRDIKLENLLLDESNNIKIIDFGFSTCIPNTKKIKIFCGTPSYMAPEIVSRKEYAGPPADIWALGVLLYAMLCGTFPFKGDSDKDLYRRITRGYFEIPDHLSTFSKALLLRILQIDPERRPTADQILVDIWLNSPDPIPKSINSARKDEHPERSYSHDTLRRDKIPPKEQPSTHPQITNNVCAGGTVNNNFHIVNNITHIITYAKEGMSSASNSPRTKNSKIGSFIDNDIVNSILRLGYTNSDVAQQMQIENSHIHVLYNKIKEQREKQQIVPVQPQYVPSIGSGFNSRQNSTRSKSRPAGLVFDKEEEINNVGNGIHSNYKYSLGSARGKILSQKNLFNNTSPFVLNDH